MRMNKMGKVEEREGEIVLFCACLEGFVLCIFIAQPLEKVKMMS